MSDDDPETQRRKLSLKRSNERVKLAATFFNGIGIATIVVAIISPIVNGTVIGLSQGMASGLMAVGFHILAQLVLQRLQSEDV